MQPELIGAIAETLGAFAVVISLFYVGKQVRESSKATRGQTYQSLIQLTGQIASNVVIDESFGEIAQKVFADTPLTEGEYYRYEAQFLMILRLVESAHYQFKLRLIDKDQLMGFANSIRRHIDLDAGKRVWEYQRSFRSTEFCEFIESFSKEKR